MIRIHLVLAAVALLCLASVPEASASTTVPPPPRPPCGAATDPVCWGSKMACQVYGPFVEDTPLKCRNFTNLDFVEIAQVASHSTGERGLDLIEAPALAGADSLLEGFGESTCKNYGVVIMITGIGTNYYCEGGTCENYGVIVMIGHSDSCFGEGYGTVCVAARCVVGPNGVHDVGRPLLA